MSRNNIPRQKSLSTPEVLNPFVHKLNLSLRDKIQIAIMSVTIAPIRLVLVLLLLLLAWPFAALAVAFRSEEDKLKPITGWRLLLRPIVLVLCRGVFFAGGLYWVKTKGKQASSKEAPLLLLAPHSSFLDALPTVFLGLTSVVAKASTQDMILFGIIIIERLKYMQMSGVKSERLILSCTTRIDTEQWKHDLFRFCSSCDRFFDTRFMNWPLVYIGRAIIVAAGFVVWPIKGNRAPPSQAPVLVAAPHSGIFDIILYFLVIPMSSPVSRNENGNIPIFGSNENKDRKLTPETFPMFAARQQMLEFRDTVTWTWEGPGAFSQLWFTLCQFYTRIEIEYLPVYTPSEAEKKDPKLFANNVREKMASCLGVPVTDHTYDDCRLMNDAEKMKLPMNAGIVEFEKLHSKLGVSYEEVQGCLKRFRDIKGSKEKEKVAQITYDEFSQYLYLPKSDALLEVFKLFDRVRV
uniref:Phospholipid/glycerol acyltransferase domain-containing protein n=1 Tax=Biomphalaria glabrata TaxID=6526 RepID=A0A2C9LMD9_BIOGL